MNNSLRLIPNLAMPLYLCPCYEVCMAFENNFSACFSVNRYIVKGGFLPSINFRNKVSCRGRTYSVPRRIACASSQDSLTTRIS